ncbi:MAG: UPF0147 family protein [Aigarchaeota archaeon]|nr:UPF0147 family protein [Aigarchaeota archaeon]MCX8192429.1 UPF0147 family protein [Nitrososphaeria archaeon]MDW7986635.1 UPF0147 family protein [Nitrososphaerota archaeon]
MSEESQAESWEAKRENVVQILESIANDTNTPRNIRRVAKAASDSLFDERYPIAVRAANAIEMIEEVINDPNMPVFARTQFWMAISILEVIRSIGGDTSTTPK